MRNLYKLEKDDQGKFNILDPDGDIIFTDKNQADLGLLLLFLNERFRDKYEISYTYNYSNRQITSSTILVDDEMVLTFTEANEKKEEETRGYGILTHLNREQYTF